jgi:hypothetical protein
MTESIFNYRYVNIVGVLVLLAELGLTVTVKGYYLGTVKSESPIFPLYLIYRD